MSLFNNWSDVMNDIHLSTTSPTQFVKAAPISGGSINAAYRLDCEARSYFIKINRSDRLDMFTAEFEGLVELSESETIRVPGSVVTGADEAHAWLVTEFIEFGRQRADSESRFGNQLAAMHRRTASEFGWHRHNTIGSTFQDNTRHSDWLTFFREQRLAYQLGLLEKKGMGKSLYAIAEPLLESVPLFFSGYTPEPSLLHGDLWGGNRAFDEHGAPVIFDPAVYYGDREADIAMTELFGGFGADFYAAYQNAWPLDEGYAVRKTLYNLYHVLNHANLFGGGYQHQAEGMIKRLLAELR